MQLLNKQLFEEVIKILDDHYELTAQQPGPLPNYLSYERLQEQLDVTINQDGRSNEQLLDDVKSYLKYSTNTCHPQFFNQLFSASFPAAQVGEFLAAMTNSTLATFEASPVATHIEKSLITTMCSLMGFTQGSGSFVSGGSQANLVGILCARHNYMPEIKSTGYATHIPLTMFISDQAHYSFSNAASILGIGTDNIIKVPTDKHGRMIVRALEDLILKSLSESKKPFCIAATAGTTVQAAFDPIDELAQVAKRYNLWLHVDGCLGGSVILSPTHKSLLSGIELADSIAWNPHKLMGVPLFCSVILLKHKHHLVNACSSTNNDYLFHEDTQNIDLGSMSVQCGRRVDILKLWFTWRFLGYKGYAAHIDHLFELARYLETKINQSTHIEFMSPRQSLSLCFRFRTSDNIDPNTFNKKLRDALYQSGKSFVNYAYIQNKLVLRATMTNHHLTKSDIDILLNNVTEQGLALINEINVKQLLLQNA